MLQPVIIFFSSPLGRAEIETIVPAAELSGGLSVPALAPTSEATVVRKIRKGETLSDIAGSLGLNSGAGNEIDAALKRAAADKGSLLVVGQPVSFGLNPEAKVVRALVPDPKGGSVEARLNSDGTFTVSAEQLKHFSQERTAYGVIETSFAAAAQKAGVPWEIIDDFVDLFSDRVAFHQDLHVGDRFTIIYRDQVRTDGKSVDSGPILAAAVEVSKGRFVAARYVGTDGKGRYFNEKGELIGEAFLRYPLKFSRVSSVFSYGRFHPVLGINRPHNGVDFAAPVGTPVRSIANGAVVFSGSNGEAGTMVKIQHNDRYSTAYMHLSKIAPGVQKGARISRGQVIGYVGATGLVTGPHLHYSFYDGGKYVDPLKINLPTLDDLEKGMKIKPVYLQRVLFTLNHYQQIHLPAKGKGV